MIYLGSGTLYFGKRVKRTWCERLFSWPWRPWVATRVVYEPEGLQVTDVKIAPDDPEARRAAAERDRPFTFTLGGKR